MGSAIGCYYFVKIEYCILVVLVCGYMRHKIWWFAWWHRDTVWGRHEMKWRERGDKLQIMEIQRSKGIEKFNFPLLSILANNRLNVFSNWFIWIEYEHTHTHMDRNVHIHHSVSAQFKHTISEGWTIDGITNTFLYNGNITVRLLLSSEIRKKRRCCCRFTICFI